MRKKLAHPAGKEKEWVHTGQVRKSFPGAFEESDGNIVLQKPANKGTAVPAEPVEGRAPTERNPEKNAANQMQSCFYFASNGLDRVRQRAEADRTSCFNNLFHFLKVDLLRKSFYELKRNATPGIDGRTWHDYERTLEERLPELERELHIGSYRATPSKRTYITKDDGRKRPLAMQVVEDKVVQQACVNIMNEVFEPSFAGFSYGYRPGRSQHDALDALHEGIRRKKINWLIDGDIEGFFDNIDHELLMGIIEERVSDKRMLRLLRKWLRVGWWEDGTRHPGTIGTPQGAVISPLLANIFLNKVMDQWLVGWRATVANGEMIAVRYADDAVIGFQYRNEAESFLVALRKRLEEYGLKLHPQKTRLIEFGRFAAENRKKRNQGKPESFDFLGFTHSCGVTRKGKFCINRKTSRKRLRRKIKEIKVSLTKRMHNPLKKVGKWLRSVVRGFFQYHAIPDNKDALESFYTDVSRNWLKTIRRRSQRGKQGWTWERFTRLQKRWLPRPRVVHEYPGIRFDAKYSR